MGQLWDGLQSLLGGILSFFYDIIPNYGVSIIFLTLVVNLLVFPLTLKQVRSTRAMQELQPEMQRLRKEYKDDPETMNKMVMNLYRERGASPLGCVFPLLVQMPIWFALFQVLRQPERGLPAGSALDMARLEGPLTFFGLNLAWEPSRVVSDSGIFSLQALPYLAMVLIVIGTGYLQQKLIAPKSATADQSPQAQSMQRITKVLPLAFGAISYIWPIGLNLYFATSNLFRTGQQLLIFKIDGRPGQEKQEKGPKKELPGGDGPEKQPPVEKPPPKPQGSRKKRSRRRRG